MNILLLGSGGREHSLALALSNSNSCGRLFVTPGNPGIWNLAEKVTLDINNHNDLLKFCENENIQLVVVGPEQPLADGISDILNGIGIPVFGPSKYCASLESSKDFAKNLMYKYKIPTANFRSFSLNDFQLAHKFIDECFLPIVLKADGLAAGKGVIIAESYNQAHNSIDDMFGGAFGVAGNKVVIEEFMEGEEASIFVITDGSDYLILPPAQDHKRIGDNDTGKNTGGMGSFAPAKIVNDKVLSQVENKIIKPLLNGLFENGTPYRGLLYIGLMIKDDFPKVVEFNVRFGDPETQVVIPLLKGDIAKLFYSAAIGKLDKTTVEILNDKYAVCVVLASGGYPDSFSKGFRINLPKLLNDGDFIYHAGTALSNNELITSGGRVLGVTSVRSKLSESIESVYQLVNQIDFQSKYYRSDIGSKGLKNESVQI